MRRLLTLILVLPFVQLHAADSTFTSTTWNDVIKTFKKREISSNYIKLSNEKLLRSVEVIDMRSDTTRVGMFSDFNYKPTEVVFENSQTLTDVLSAKLADENNLGYTVLIVVQDFWLNEQRAQKYIGKDNQEKPEIHTSKVVCKMDVFIQYENKYLPLTRIDTTLWDKKSLASSGRELTSGAFSIINQQIKTAINDPKFLSRKKATMEEITTAYKQRFSYPAFIDECPKKGLYASLEEFKNNKPFTQNFVIKAHTKEPPSLYIVDDKGNEIFTRNVWGVSDGKNMYIMQKGMLFKLYKNANAFYWMGLKYFDLRMYETPPASPVYVDAKVGMEEPVANNVKIRLTPFLLHPETGEGY